MLILPSVDKNLLRLVGIKFDMISQGFPFGNPSLLNKDFTEDFRSPILVITYSRIRSAPKYREWHNSLGHY
jgi:hypothetical protein